jgi:perosamine synthetase
VLQSGMLVQGERVRAFEALVAARAGTRYAVAVGSGTAALHLGLLAMGVGRGDRVAVPAYSWPATANVVVLCGAEPVFVDIEPRTMGMDAQRLADALAGGGISAVVPVHAFGAMAEIGPILEVADRHGAAVLEDAACALGAAAGGRPAGAWGVAGCFSFHPRKAVTTGEGGAVTTDDATLARSVRMLRNHGLDPDSPTPDFVAAGFNQRMTEFQAALGEVQLRRAPEIIGARRRVAGWYDAALRGSVCVPPTVSSPEAHVYQSYVVRLPEEAAARRTDLIAELRAREIETTIGTYHIPLTTYYRDAFGYAAGDFPVADDVAASALSLPLHTRMSEADVDLVVSSLLDLVGAAAMS